MKTDLFQSCGHCWVFQIGWHIECSTFTALSFRIWNSSTVIPSPPLALFVVMLVKAHLWAHLWLHIPGCLALGLIRYHLFIFTFASFSQIIYPKTVLVKLMSKHLLPMFSSRSFMASGLRSLVHFEFILLRKYASFILLNVAVPFSKHHHCETVFRLLYIFAFFVVD